LTEDGEVYFTYFYTRRGSKVKMIDLAAPPYYMNSKLDVPDPDSSFLVYTLTSTNLTTSANGNELSGSNTCIIKLELNLKNSMSGVIYSSVGQSDDVSSAVIIYIHDGTLYAQGGVTNPVTREMSWVIPDNVLRPYKIYISFSLNNTYDVQKMIVNHSLVVHDKTSLTNNVLLSSPGKARIGYRVPTGITLKGSNIDNLYIAQQNPRLSLYSNSNCPLCL
jgi:hypothetical protein